MMTGGFAVNGQMVTLTDITCPILAFVGEVDDIGQPRVCARYPAGGAERRGIRIPHPHRTFRPGRGIQGGQGELADRRRMGALAVHRRRQAGEHRPDGRSAGGAHRQRRGIQFPPRARHRRGLRGGAGAGPRRGRRGRRGQQIHAHAGGGDGPDAAAAGPAGTDQRSHPDLAGPHHRRTGTRCPAGRIPVVRRARAHLRGREPPHQQRRSRPDRGRGAAGRPRGRADGNAAQRTGRHRRAVPAGRGRRGDAARRRPGRVGPARGSDRDHDRPHQPGCRAQTAGAGAGAGRR